VFAYGNGQVLSNSPSSFGGTVSVRLTNVYPGGPIFYTLDGSTPSFSSSQYTAPFTVTHNVTLRTLGYSSDFIQSGQSDPIDILIVPTYTLTTNSPGGGTISLSPSGGSYLSNALVTLTGVPSSGWQFIQWLGDASGTNASTSINITRNKSVQAIFGTTLNTTVAGSGSVSLSPPGGFYPYASVITLVAIPQAGNYFALWNNAATGNVNPLRFTLTNTNPTVSSLFAALSGSQVALTVIPVGYGQVSVNPRSNVYNLNDSLSITAVPDPGQSFLNWSGDASGTQNPLPVMMTQSKTIYANFSRRPSLSFRSGLDGRKPEGFQFTLSGEFGATYSILTSTNLTNFSPYAFVTNTYGTSQMLDTNIVSIAPRFYRALLLQ